jgi:hypothetical protein
VEVISKSSAQRSAVRSIAWLGVALSGIHALELCVLDYHIIVILCCLHFRRIVTMVKTFETEGPSDAYLMTKQPIKGVRPHVAPGRHTWNEVETDGASSAARKETALFADFETPPKRYDMTDVIFEDTGACSREIGRLCRAATQRRACNEDGAKG